QEAVGSGELRRHLVTLPVLSDALRRQREVRPRAAVGIDDALRQEIGDALAAGRAICREEIVEGESLADEDDERVDRGCRPARRSLGKRGSGERQRGGESNETEGRLKQHAAVLDRESQAYMMLAPDDDNSSQAQGNAATRWCCVAPSC